MEQQTMGRTPEWHLLTPEVMDVMEPLAEVVDLDLYAKALEAARQAVDPADRRVVLSDFSKMDGYFADGGRGSVRATPLRRFANLPQGYEAYAKFDNEQPIGAYKLRGAQLAVNLALQRQPGIKRFTTGSAGNAALALGYAVQSLNKAAYDRGELAFDEQGNVTRGELLEAHIYGKRDMSEAKRVPLQEMERWGVRLHTDYDGVDKAIAVADEMARTDFGRLAVDKASASDTYFVPPFDHFDVMAGQGTMMLELLADLTAQGVDLRQARLRILVPVGGGGLLGGVLAVVQWAKAKGILAEDAEAIGVQVDGTDAAARQYYHEPALTAETLQTKSDGTAVLQATRVGWELIRDNVAGFVRLSEQELGRGMDHLSKQFHVRVEPAGGHAAAALLKIVDAYPDSPLRDGRQDVFVALVTGQNATAELRRYFQELFLEPYRIAAAALSETYLRREVHGLAEIVARRGGSDPRLARRVGSLVASGPAVGRRAR